jgi:CRP/FNR family cyclic AMP-dependent transcriptional regulator
MTDNSLAGLAIFRGMSAGQREEALSKAQHIEVKSGEKLISQGETEQNLWFSLSGHCEVKRRTAAGKELKLAELGPRSQFGEMSFFHASPNSADVIATTDMRLLRLSRKDYDRLCESGNPVAFKIALNSLEQLSDRLRRTDQWVTDLVTEGNHKPSASEWTSFRELVFQ